MADVPHKIVGLDGKPVDEPGQVNAGVVDLLERLLAEARTGKVDGVAVCYTMPEPDGEQHFKSSWAGPKITLLGAMSRQIFALNMSLNYRDCGAEIPHDER